MKSLSRVQHFVTPWTVAHQAPPSMEFSRQAYWSGLPFPSPGDLPDPGIEPGFPALRADTLPYEPAGNPRTPPCIYWIRTSVSEWSSVMCFHKPWLNLKFYISRIKSSIPPLTLIMTFNQRRCQKENIALGQGNGCLLTGWSGDLEFDSSRFKP